MSLSSFSAAELSRTSLSLPSSPASPAARGLLQEALSRRLQDPAPFRLSSVSPAVAPSSSSANTTKPLHPHRNPGGTVSCSPGPRTAVRRLLPSPPPSPPTRRLCLWPAPALPNAPSREAGVASRRHLLEASCCSERGTRAPITPRLSPTLRLLL